MTKKDLSERITDMLLDGQLLNELDYPDLDSLKDDVKNMILDCLQDYIIISGKILADN